MYVLSVILMFLANIKGSIIDSNGEWRAEEGRYKKTELCREHDLDVRPPSPS
jgi:hypothetical protein